MWRLVLLLTLPVPVLAEEPRFDSIEYDSPSKYLAIQDTLGDIDAIARHAASLKSENDRTTVRNVLNWMESNLKYDAQRAYTWRNYDTVVAQRCYGSCADYAIVCGVLLKAAGIPTVWVKTMDVPWVWDFKKKRHFESWSGHVFLEVYLDKKWVLLDPGAATIYQDYSPKSRILPGNRFAYHKGDDPKRMVMSLQWEEWKEQTASYFTALDESLLPVDPKSAVGLKRKCYIVGNSPYYQFLDALARQNGMAVATSFNCEYDKYLPMAKGHVILIETHAGVPIVDTQILQQHFPSLPDGFQKGKKRLSETTVIFVDFADVLADIQTKTSAAH